MKRVVLSVLALTCTMMVAGGCAKQELVKKDDQLAPAPVGLPVARFGRLARLGRFRRFDALGLCHAFMGRRRAHLQVFDHRQGSKDLAPLRRLANPPPHDLLLVQEPRYARRRSIAV